MKSLIRLASLQTSFLAMDEALKVTNRRVNALENVTIPAIVDVVTMINRELDELEREDFTRLKKVQGKKLEKMKIEEEERLARTEGAKNDNAVSNITHGYDASDDADVVFK